MVIFLHFLIVYACYVVAQLCGYGYISSGQEGPALIDRTERGICQRYEREDTEEKGYACFSIKIPGPYRWSQRAAE